MRLPKIPFIIVLITLTIKVNGQSLKIYDLSNHTEITDSIISIQSTDNHGWIGFESLDLYVQVENISPSTIETGAKKIEIDPLQPDVLHSICFGGACYSPSVFDSPNHVTLQMSQSDSGFVAHYLFDNRVHVRGQTNVIYVFYDVANPNDSVFVNVIYNTQIATGIETANNNSSSVTFYPNPADNKITFHLANIQSGFISNSSGEKIISIQNPALNELTVQTNELADGLYFYELFEENRSMHLGKFLIVH